MTKTTAKTLKRDLRRVDSEKPQLVQTAKQLALIDRVALREQDYESIGGGRIGRQVTTVHDDAEFRTVWESIVDVMGVIAPVETSEDTVDGDVCFSALASGSRRELLVQYRKDGSLSVKARWAASADVSRAMVVVDETYPL